MLKQLFKHFGKKNRVLDAAAIARFHRDGILVIDSGIPVETLDGAVGDLAGFWDGSKRPGNPADEGTIRVTDAWAVSDNIRRVAAWPNILDALADLYDKKPLPFQTLNFRKGTEQKAHSDSIHFNTEPFGLMCGVWVALEDIGPDQGPLVYYPGSNDLPEMNFEDMGLKPSYGEYPKYEAHLEHLVEKHGFKPVYGVIPKGSAIIWSANVLHGGSKQNNKDLTRLSQVTHYFFEGARPWRPGFSENGRAYFEPRWIPVDAVAQRPAG